MSSKPLLVGSVVVASGVFAAFALTAPAPQTAPPPTPPAQPVVSTATVMTAHMLGFSTKSLAASGVTSQQATAILENIAESPTLVTALDSADEAASAAGQALTAAQETLRGPFATSESFAAVTTAQTAFSEAMTARLAARTALFNAATESLAPETKAKIVASTAGAVHRVPTEFTVVARTPEEWMSIEVALRAEARAVRLETTLAESHATLLAAVRSEEDVIAAETALASGLAGIETAYASAAAVQLPGGGS